MTKVKRVYLENGARLLLDNKKIYSADEIKIIIEELKIIAKRLENADIVKALTKQGLSGKDIDSCMAFYHLY